jgi:hypothetical protein
MKKIDILCLKSCGQMGQQLSNYLITAILFTPDIRHFGVI